jgi:hypothetical protein
VTPHPFVSGVTGVLTTASGVPTLIEHMKPVGGLAVYFIDTAHDYGVPVLVAVPLALLVLCALAGRWLTRRGWSGHPFESDEPVPPVCHGEGSVRAQGWGHS